MFFLRAYRWYIPPQYRSHGIWKYAAFAVGGSTIAYLMAMAADFEREKRRRQRWQTYRLGLGQPAKSIYGGGAISRWWNHLRESEKTIIGLIAMNSAVFLAWRLAPLQPFMRRTFLHSIHSHPVTMGTSIFSHMSGSHLLVNMIALYSFGGMLHERLGREQFLAFYFTGGLAASLGSHLVKYSRGDLTPSLGASGAVLAVAAGCAHQPDLRVSLIFLPFISVPIKFALPAMMTYDAVGLFKRWSAFDHAAHLSGAMFGFFMYAASTRHLWPRRHKILTALGYPIK